MEFEPLFGLGKKGEKGGLWKKKGTQLFFGILSFHFLLVAIRGQTTLCHFSARWLLRIDHPAATGGHAPVHRCSRFLAVDCLAADGTSALSVRSWPTYRRPLNSQFRPQRCANRPPAVDDLPHLHSPKTRQAHVVALRTCADKLFYIVENAAAQQVDLIDLRAQQCQEPLRAV